MRVADRAIAAYIAARDARQAREAAREQLVERVLAIEALASVEQDYFGLAMMDAAEELLELARKARG